MGESERFQERLMTEIMNAARSVLTDLFSNKEHYYYITLVTDGLANTPCVSAWSYEALDKEKLQDAEDENQGFSNIN